MNNIAFKSLHLLAMVGIIVKPLCLCSSGISVWSNAHVWSCWLRDTLISQCTRRRLLCRRPCPVSSASSPAKGLRNSTTSSRLPSSHGKKSILSRRGSPQKTTLSYWVSECVSRWPWPWSHTSLTFPLYQYRVSWFRGVSTLLIKWPWPTYEGRRHVWSRTAGLRHWL